MTRDRTTLGRPVSFSRERAIDQAMQLFWSDGYQAVTATDLADAMGIQRSSFYNSFGTKEAVFTEAVETYARQAPDAILDSVQPGDPAIPTLIKALRALCRARAGDKDARGCLICNSIAELIGVDETLGPMLNSALKMRIESMERLFELAVEQKEYVPSSSVEDVARTTVSFLIGVNVISKVIRSERELWGICRTFLQGIGVGEQLIPD